MPSATCGWIIDLRGNGGGNMYPMLAGLKPFLGDTVLGAFVGPDKTRANWVAGRGIKPPPALAPLESIKADRTGREYGGKLDPDEVVGGANAAAAENDATVAAARWWLQQESRCSAAR